MVFPAKSATVNDGASESSSVTTHEFGQRMHYNVGAIFDWAHQNGGGYGVVNHQRNTVFVGDQSKCFNVADVSGRIPNTLTKNSSRAPINQPFYCARLI